MFYHFGGTKFASQFYILLSACVRVQAYAHCEFLMEFVFVHCIDMESPVSIRKSNVGDNCYQIIECACVLCIRV